MLETSVSTSQADGVWIVALRGEHDLSTLDEVERTLERVSEEGSKIVIDLGDASFIESSILAAILAVRERADGVGPAVAIVAPPGTEPRRLLDLVGLGRLVSVFPNRELAVAALAKRPISLIAIPAHARPAR